MFNRTPNTSPINFSVTGLKHPKTKVEKSKVSKTKVTFESQEIHSVH